MRRRHRAITHPALSTCLVALASALACSQAPPTTEAPLSTAFVPLAADTKTTTSAGSTFIAPAGWSVATRGTATIVQAPEGDTRIAFVDVRANDSAAGSRRGVGRVRVRDDVAAQGRD